MKAPRVVLLSSALLSLFLSEGVAGEILGPFRGSVPVSQRRLNRVAPHQVFRTTSLPMPAEPRKKLRREPVISLAGQPPATGPAGTNFVLDLSTVRGISDIPPLILADFAAIPRTEAYPPDPVIAAGPHHLVAAVNREIRFFKKDGTLLEAVHAGAWFDALVPGCLPFDPRVLYDHFAGRFVMLWHHYGSHPDVSYYLLSVSSGDDPTGEWVSWALPGDVNGSTPSGTWADNGCLGFDSSALYIASNQYTFKPMDPKDVRIRILPKSNLYWPQRGDSVRWSDFVLGGAFCVRPAVVHGHSAAYYLLEVPDPLPYSTGVVLYRIDDPVANPRLSSAVVPVTEYFRAKNAHQRDVDSPLDIRKSYLHSEVHLVNGQIHAVHSIANPVAFDYSALRYLRISTASATATEDVTFGAPGYWYFYPALAVDRDENVVITFARSSTTEYPGCHMTWRYAGDGSTLRPSSLVQPGWAEYAQLDGAGANRWGDYSGAALDPLDRQSFWLMGEYAEGRNVWGTWARSVRVVPFAVPRLVASRQSIDFGYVDVEGPLAKGHLTLRNGGSAPLTIGAVSSTSPTVSPVGLPPLPLVLGMYDSVGVDLTITPTDTGAISEELTITTNDMAEPQRTIPLRGTGIRPRGLSPGEIIVLQADRSGSYLRLVNGTGGIEGSMALSAPAVHALSASSGAEQLYGVAQHPHGAAIVRLDRADGHQYPLYTIALHGVTAIGVMNADTIYCGTDAGGVYRYVPSTSSMTLVAQRWGIGFSGLVSSGAERLWASAGYPASNDTVYAINLASGSIVPVGRTGSFVRTNSICRGPDGNLLALVDYALLRLDTLTGAGSFQAFIALEGLRSIAAGRLITGVGGGGPGPAPLEFVLEQNYPNPFNPATLIRYQLPAQGDVKLIVYDMLGRQVALLVDEKKSPGRYEVTFDAARLASGVYFCRLSAGPRVQTRKMLIVR